MESSTADYCLRVGQVMRQIARHQLGFPPTAVVLFAGQMWVVDAADVEKITRLQSAGIRGAEPLAVDWEAFADMVTRDGVAQGAR